MTFRLGPGDMPLFYNSSKSVVIRVKKFSSGFSMCTSGKVGPFQAAGKVRCVACSGSAKAAWACSMSRLMSAISASVCASSHRRVGQTSRSHADCSKGPARWLRTDTGIVLLRPQVAKDDDGQVGAVKVLRERVDDVDLLRRAAPGFAGRAPSAWHRLRIEAAAVRPPRATVPRSFSSFCRTGSSRCS